MEPFGDDDDLFNFDFSFFLFFAFLKNFLPNPTICSFNHAILDCLVVSMLIQFKKKFRAQKLIFPCQFKL